MATRLISQGNQGEDAVDNWLLHEQFYVSHAYAKFHGKIGLADTLFTPFQSESKGKGDYQIEYTPAPRITEADKTNDRKSLNRALDRRLYLLLYGNAYGAPSDKPVWHFPEKVYDAEETLRKCAESALHSVLGDLSNTYFVGNAPMGHMTITRGEDAPDLPSFKRFFFKSQVIAKDEFNVGKCKDFVWVTKDELLEYFPDQGEFLSKMIIS